MKQIKISEVKLAQYNPRQISQQDLDKIKTSLKEFGFLQPVIINKDKTVISGHQRIRAWQELGHDTVPVELVNLTKTKEKALNLAINKIGGQWDVDKIYASYMKR